MPFPWEVDATIEVGLSPERLERRRKRQAHLRSVDRSKKRKRAKPKKEPWWYPEYLKSDHWQEFRLRYAESNMPQACLVCGDPKYEIHHRTYERLGEEFISDVVPLCRAHHHKTHVLVKTGVDLWDAHTKLIVIDAG